MSGAEILLVVIGMPFVLAAGVISGRYAQWKYWEMDKPYEERVRNLRKQ